MPRELTGSSCETRKSRARRVLGVIGAVVGTTVTFVAATAAAAVVHLDAPSVRRLVASQANAIMKKQFAGDVAVERIGSLGLRGIDGVRFRVKDPTGMQVLFVDGARVRVRALAVVRSALFGKGDIVIPVDLASIEYVDAAIDGDAAGNMRIANAFAERTPTPATPSDPSARGVRVEAPSVALRAAWVHGQAPGAPPIDAELHELVGHGHYDAKLIKADLDRVDLVMRGLPRGVDPRGRIGGKFIMPSATGRNMGVSAAFDGVIAGVPTSAHGRMDGQTIDAVVDGRDPSGEGVRSTFGEVAVKEEVTLHAEAHGELPHVAAKAHVAVGRGTVDVDGHADLSDGTKADAVIALRHIDLHGVVASLPVSDVGLDTKVDIAIAKSGAITGNVVLDTQPGSVAGQTLPLLALRGNFTKETAHATGRVVDSRATADFEVDVANAFTNPLIQGHVHGTVADFSRLPDLGAKMKGHATFTVDGTANLGSKAIAARAHVVGGGLAYGPGTVDNATVLATATGTIDHPVVDVGVHAGGVVAGGQKIGVADVRGRVEPGAVTTISNVQVDVVKDGRNVSATARRVQVGGPGTFVDGAVITGLGAPLHADFAQTAGEIHVKLDGPSIDLVRVATLAGNAHAVKTGLLAVKGDITLRRDGASGQMHAEIDRLSTEEVNGGKVVLDLQVEGRKVDLAMTAELGQAGTLEIATRRLVVDGSPSDPASWKRAHGAAKFSANLDAAKIATLVPKESLPFSELRGQIVIEGAVHRDSANVPPELSVHAHTRGLVVAGKAPPERDLDSVHGKKVSGVQPWRSEGIDASFDARVDPASGLGEVAFHSVDKKGTLVGFDAKSILPYEQLLKEPDHAVALLQKTPVTAKLVVPKRALSDFPDFSGLRNLLGTVELEIDVAGTSLEPHFALVAHARDVGSPSLSAKLASDADVTVHYDGKQARLLGNLKSGKKPSLEIDAQLDVLAKDLVSPTPGQDLPWGGSGHVKLARFPLQSVNVLADRRIRGHVSGEATVVDLHKAAQLDAHLAFEDLKMGRAAYKSGNIVVIAKDGKLSAGARLEQTDGFADIQAATGLFWGDKLVPAIDPNADLQAHLEAKGFRAAALLPFVSAQLNELDGRIDANTTVKIGPGFTNPTLEGNIDFHDGTLQLAAVGEEYKKAKAKFLFQPGGMIKVEDIYLQGTEGQLSGEGLVKTRGLGFEYAKANVVIPKKRPLDLAVRGQGLGAVSGNVSIVATNSADGKNMKVEVDVPTLALVLPQKIKSGVQELSPKEDIRVGVFRDPKNFVKLPLDKQDLEPPAGEKPVGTIIDVDVKLGEATVTQGTMAKIVLTGTPHIKITNTTEVSGQISVKEGQIDVQGKKFEIVKGTITFQPQDTSNPVVVAQATWTAEDGTHVYADFVGPVKTGKVTLSSDTGLKPSEVLAVILFGTADGVSGAPKSTASTTGGQKAAVGAGGGFATQGLTEAMDDLTGIQATAKIDTTRSANPAPEIEVQIAKGVSLAFEHVLGTPPITQPDTNLATVDWRFRSNWSLETTFGDRGLLQTDAVWQKRY